MRKKHKIIIGIAIFVILLIIGGIFYFLHYQDDIDSKLKNKNEKNKITNEKKEVDNNINEKETIKIYDDKENKTVSSSSNKQNEIKKSDTKTNNNSNSNSSVKKDNNKTNNKTQNYSTNNSNQNNSNYNQDNASTSTNKNPTPPTQDPNAVDTTHLLYSTHHGHIDSPSLQECNLLGEKKQIASNYKVTSWSCVEVYAISGKVLGYYLELHYD